MSQRKFTSNGKAALVGWDRPLQYFFLVISEAGGDILYSNLDDPAGPGLSLDVIRERLAGHDMGMPMTLTTDLEADRYINAGNVVVDYGDVPGLMVPPGATGKIYAGEMAFPNLWSGMSRCFLEVWREEDGAAIVMATQLLDNEGLSVTSGFERIATQALACFGLNPAHTIWIEHYPDRRPGQLCDDADRECFSRVEMAYLEQPRCVWIFGGSRVPFWLRFEHPVWTRLEAGDPLLSATGDRRQWPRALSREEYRAALRERAAAPPETVQAVEDGD